MEGSVASIQQLRLGTNGLTQRLEKFSAAKLPIEEDGAVLCVKTPAHSNQNHLHRS